MYNYLFYSCIYKQLHSDKFFSRSDLRDQTIKIQTENEFLNLDTEIKILSKSGQVLMIWINEVTKGQFKKR